MLKILEAVPVHALLLQRPDEALDHAVLLRAVRGDELLFQPVASDNGREVEAGEDQAIVWPQQELLLDPRPRDQRMHEDGAGRRGLARLRQVPSRTAP